MLTYFCKECNSENIQRVVRQKWSESTQEWVIIGLPVPDSTKQNSCGDCGSLMIGARHE